MFCLHMNFTALLSRCSVLAIITVVSDILVFDFDMILQTLFEISSVFALGAAKFCRIVVVMSINMTLKVMLGSCNVVTEIATKGNTFVIVTLGVYPFIVPFNMIPSLALKFTNIAIKSFTLMLDLFVNFKKRFCYCFEIANITDISYTFVLVFLM